MVNLDYFRSEYVRKQQTVSVCVELDDAVLNTVVFINNQKNSINRSLYC